MKCSRPQEPNNVARLKKRLNRVTAQLDEMRNENARLMVYIASEGKFSDFLKWKSLCNAFCMKDAIRVLSDTIEQRDEEAERLIMELEAERNK